jgi:hypothetical protein
MSMMSARPFFRWQSEIIRMSGDILLRRMTGPKRSTKAAEIGLGA